MSQKPIAVGLASCAALAALLLGVEERQYGKLGETVYEKKTVTTFTDPLHPSVFETHYHFETFGRLLRITYPDLEVLTNTYDSGGNLARAEGVKAEAASGIGFFKHIGLTILDKLTFGLFGLDPDDHQRRKPEFQQSREMSGSYFESLEQGIRERGAEQGMSKEQIDATIQRLKTE